MQMTETVNEDAENDQVMDRLNRLIRLYEGAIDYLGRSVKAREAGQSREFTDLLDKGRNIIQTFKSTLDHEQGGDVARQLNDLYDFMLENLAKAEKTLDPKPVDKVIRYLHILLDGWRGAQPQIAVEANP